MSDETNKHEAKTHTDEQLQQRVAEWLSETNTWTCDWCPDWKDCDKTNCPDTPSDDVEEDTDTETPSE